MDLLTLIILKLFQNFIIKVASFQSTRQTFLNQKPIAMFWLIAKAVATKTESSVYVYENVTHLNLPRT